MPAYALPASKDLPGPLFDESCKPLPARDLAFIVDGKGIGKPNLLLGLKKNDNRAYLWERAANSSNSSGCVPDALYSRPLCTEKLVNVQGAPVTSDLLKFVLLADLDGSQHPTIVGLQANTAWAYAWKLISGQCAQQLTLSPMNDGPLINQQLNSVPVNELTFVVAADFNGDGKQEIRGVQQKVYWNYGWELAEKGFSLRYDGSLHAGSGNGIEELDGVQVISGGFSSANNFMLGWTARNRRFYIWDTNEELPRYEGTLCGGSAISCNYPRAELMSGELPVVEGRNESCGKACMVERVPTWRVQDWDTGSGNWNAALVCDFNGDGAEDIAVPLDESRKAWRLISFQAAPGGLRKEMVEARLFSEDISAAAAGDVDGDGACDLLAVTETNHRFLVKQGPLLSHAPPVEWASHSLPKNISDITEFHAGDVDGDGLADAMLLLADASVYLLRSSGTGFFPAVDIRVGPASTIAVGDLNDDRRVELIAVQKGKPDVLVVGEHDGSGFTKLQQLTGPRADEARSIHIGTFKSTCRGILLSGPNPLISYCPGQETELKSLPSWGEKSAVLVADLNGDMLDDIVLADKAGTNARYVQKDGSFTESHVDGLAAGIELPVLLAGDFDGDGRKNPAILGFNGRLTVLSDTASLVPVVRAMAALRSGLSSYTDNGGMFGITAEEKDLHPTLTKTGLWFYAVRAQKRLRDGSLRERSDFFTPVELPGRNKLPICVGFNPETSTWGPSSHCPNGHGIIATNFGNGSPQVTPKLFCCRLPSDDILLGEKTMQEGVCPANTIAVGMSGRTFECASLNAQRYFLSERRPGSSWVLDYVGGGQFEQIRHNRIPAAIRYAVGRLGHRQWDGGGCIGNPEGALFLGMSDSACGGMFFGTLMYQGLGNDPKKGTPVKMFADCDDISDRFSPYPKCLNGKGEP